MCIGMGHVQRKAKTCSRCRKRFIPTGANCKRCPQCRPAHHLDACKKRWHATYKKTGYAQTGSNNNAWKGGSSPAYYRKTAFTHHGTRCLRCGAPAVLVHHKDGNRRNAELSNLEVLCKRCHQLEHRCAGNLPRKVVFKTRACDSCTSSFQPTGPRSRYCPECSKARAKV